MPESGIFYEDETIARAQEHAAEVGNSHASPQPRVRYGSHTKRRRMRRIHRCHACSRPAKVHLAAFRGVVARDWPATVTLDRDACISRAPVLDFGHRALHGTKAKVSFWVEE